MGYSMSTVGKTEELYRGRGKFGRQRLLPFLRTSSVFEEEVAYRSVDLTHLQ